MTTPRTDQVATTSAMARHLGISVTTLQSAIDRGSVESAQLAFGERVVVVKSAQDWYAGDRPRGRPKSKAETP